METDTPICEAFDEIAMLAMRLGVAPINALPGCWEHDVDGHWWIAVNGHKQPVECSRGVTVRPFDCYVEWNGFPAGRLNPAGGFIAAGEAANEESFIAALRGSSPITSEKSA